MGAVKRLRLYMHSALGLVLQRTRARQKPPVHSSLFAGVAQVVNTCQELPRSSFLDNVKVAVTEPLTLAPDFFCRHPLTGMRQHLPCFVLCAVTCSVFSRLLFGCVLLSGPPGCSHAHTWPAGEAGGGRGTGLLLGRERLVVLLRLL